MSDRDVVNLDRDWQSERFGSHRGDAVLRVLAGIADRRLVTPAQIAVAWVLGNPQVSSAIISAPGIRELRELIGATDLVLTAEESGALASVTAVRDDRMELRHA
jgi:aryl-alcohol dehydrogenase-like predicted oxidoreductase